MQQIIQNNIASHTTLISSKRPCFLIWGNKISSWLQKALRVFTKRQHSLLWAIDNIYTEPKNTQKCFVISFTKHDRFWYNLVDIFLRNFAASDVNVFHFTWITSLQYLTKLSIHVLQVDGSWNCEPKKHQNDCHILYKTRPILIKFKHSHNVV